MTTFPKAPRGISLKEVQRKSVTPPTIGPGCYDPYSPGCLASGRIFKHGTFRTKSEQQKLKEALTFIPHTLEDMVLSFEDTDIQTFQDSVDLPNIKTENELIGTCCKREETFESFKARVLGTPGVQSETTANRHISRPRNESTASGKGYLYADFHSVVQAVMTTKFQALEALTSTAHSIEVTSTTSDNQTDEDLDVPPPLPEWHIENSENYFLQ